MFESRTAAALLTAGILALTGAAPPPGPEPQAAPVDTGSTQAAVVHKWGRVISGDEFSYTGPPDPAKWKVYDSVGHDGNGIRSPAAWSVADGVVTVSGDAAGTTGGMSARFGHRKYGRWEARMKTSARDSQYHPVLLLWPDNTKNSNCAEIDYAEGTSDRTLVKFFLHYACRTKSKYQTVATAAVDTTQWHNYAVQWTRSGITGYIDGVPWFTDTDRSHLPTGRMHQTVQLDWFPDGTPTTPTQMQVDWIRVYR